MESMDGVEDSEEEENSDEEPAKEPWDSAAKIAALRDAALGQRAVMSADGLAMPPTAMSADYVAMPLLESLLWDAFRMTARMADPPLVEELALCTRSLSRCGGVVAKEMLSELGPPPSLLQAVEMCPPRLHLGLVAMLQCDSLTPPTYARHMQAMREGGAAGAAAQWRVELHLAGERALLALQSAEAGQSFTSWHLRLKVAKLMAPARMLETHVLALKCLNQDGSGVYLIHPEYVCTVHAGKPASRFTMDPVPRSGKGSQVRGKAAGKAVVRALPSSAAVHQLAMWSVGQQLLGALRMPTVLPPQVVARPSRFALLLLFYEAMAERCRRLDMLWSKASYEAAAAWLSGAAYLPTMGLDVLGARWLSSGWLHNEQAMMVEPHAIFEVWSKTLYTQTNARRAALISLTDGQRWSHPRLNAGDVSFRTTATQRLMYFSFLESARMIYDSLDASQTMMVLDVAGRIPQHAAAYGARLHHDATLADAEQVAAVICAGSQVILSVGRTVDPYKNRTKVATKENAEGLHSLMSLVKSAGALILAGITVEHGGSSDGKMQATQSGFAMPRPKEDRPRQGARLMKANEWKQLEEVRVTALNEREMLLRLAMGHLAIEALSSIDGAQIHQHVLLPAAESLPERPLRFLAPFYDEAQQLLHTQGLFRVTPWAAVKVTATRWDLQKLFALEVSRRAHAQPWLMVRPPNEAALANGMLKAELGSESSLARWRTPHSLLAERLRHAEAVPPPPPIWWDPSSAVPPRMPSDAEDAALAVWRHSHMVGRGHQKASAAADGSIAAAILPTRTRCQLVRAMIASGAASSVSKLSEALRSALLQALAATPLQGSGWHEHSVAGEQGDELPMLQLDLSGTRMRRDNWSLLLQQVVAHVAMDCPCCGAPVASHEIVDATLNQVRPQAAIWPHQDVVIGRGCASLLVLLQPAHQGGHFRIATEADVAHDTVYVPLRECGDVCCFDGCSYAHEVSQVHGSEPRLTVSITLACGRT